jgi:uncharacterized protein YxjI
MRYLMKKFFSIGGTFTSRMSNPKTSSGDGKAFQFRHQLTFATWSGNELAFIKQGSFLGSHIRDIQRGQLFAVIKKELFSFFKQVFTTDVPGRMIW